MTNYDVLVTGPTGLIGKRLVLELAREGYTMGLAMRGAEGRIATMREWLRRRGADPTLVHPVPYDLSAPPRLGDEAPRYVVHLAAHFAWGLERAWAQRVHVDASLELLEWASTLESLERFVFVGGYRVALELESPWEGEYERSKREAYERVRERARELGVGATFVHPSTVLPDDEVEDASQFDVGVHGMLGALWRGELPALPGARDTFVPLTRADHLARLLVGALERPEALDQDLFVLDDDTPALPDLIARAASHMGVAAPTRTVPVSLLARLPSRLTGAHREELAFLDRATYPTQSAHALERTLELSPPPLEDVLEHTIERSLRTSFGRTPAEDGALEGGLWVRRGGEGDATLMLHGLPVDGSCWDEVSRTIGGESIRPDLPGMGKSKEADPFDPAHVSGLLGARGARVVAHSLGCSVALELAAAHPELVHELVLVAPAFLQRPAPLPHRMGALTAALVSADDLARQIHPELGREHAAVDHAMTLLELRSGAKRRLARALRRASSASRRARDLELLRACPVPVRVVTGSNDPLTITPPEGVDEHVIEGAGHWPQITHPTRLAALL